MLDAPEGPSSPRQTRRASRGRGRLGSGPRRSTAARESRGGARERGRGGGAEPERRRRRATSGGGQNVVDFPVLEPAGCGGKRQSCKKWQSAFGSRAVCGCFIRRKCTSSQHRCAPRASMHASFVTCGQYRVSGTGSTEKSAGAGARRASLSVLPRNAERRGALRRPQSRERRRIRRGNARVPAVLHATVATELLHEAEPRARVARCDAARRSRRPQSRREARDKRNKRTSFFFFKKEFF